MPHARLHRFAPRMRKLLLPVAALALGSLGTASSANAGPLVTAAGTCGSQTLSQPFLPWLDTAHYTPLPGGSFEGTLPGWTLSKARVIAGNEPFYVRSGADKKALSLPAGASASSSVICVGLDHPTMRFFARSSGGLPTDGLRVDVLFELSTGQVTSLTIGTALAGTHRSWQPTLPMTVVANLLPLLPDGRTPVSFRFTPVGAASWTIDDVYVDPRRK